MRTISIVALGAMALSATGALANTTAPNPMIAPLTYATPERGWFKPPYPIGVDSDDKLAAQAYTAERAELLRKYLALEEANGGKLTAEHRAAMREDIAALKMRFAIP